MSRATFPTVATAVLAAAIGLGPSTATAGDNSAAVEDISVAFAPYQQISAESPTTENYINGWNCAYTPHARWKAWGDVQVGPGNDQTLLDGTGFIPLWQDQRTLLFANIRGQLNDRDDYEGNWALGMRKMINDTWILGGYASYDRRWTDESNEFDQGALGIEALSVEWEFRANGYIPEEKQSRTGTPRPGVPGVFFKGVQTAYYGFDAEIGKLLAAWGDNNDVELRGFAGGYHFDNEERLRNISGPKFRVELRMYDLSWLGDQSRVTLGANYQWDQVRDDRTYAFIRVRIPFGKGGAGRRLSPLERRMVDRIVRDDDIVVNETIERVGNPLPPPMKSPAPAHAAPTDG